MNLFAINIFLYYPHLYTNTISSLTIFNPLLSKLYISLYYPYSNNYNKSI